MWQLRAGTIGLLILATACGASRSPMVATTPAPKAAAEPIEKRIPVQIDNENVNDMNIYLMSFGQRLLLGEAAGLTRTTLSIPPGTIQASGRATILADPAGGGGRIVMPSLIVSPGETIYLTIGSDPSTSMASAG